MEFMLSLYNFLLCISWFCFECHAVAAANYITATQLLRDPDTLVSSNAIFKVSFFSPTNSTNRYLGVWYNHKDDSDSDVASEVVWIANRDNPLNTSSGVLKISEDRNLQVLDEQNIIFWSSDLSNNDQANSTIAQILDTGNLVLLSNATGETIWQSFEHLTHALLPPARLNIEVNENGTSVLRSWKSASDPSSGLFSFGVLPRNLPEFFTLYDDKPYWRSGPWNGYLFLGVPNMYSEVSTGIQINSRNRSRLEVTYSVANPALLQRFVVSYDGRLSEQEWNVDSGKWHVTWKSFESECEAYGKCGAFGSCDPKNSPICSCLKGFKPSNKDEWEKGNWTSGCFRRTPLQCGAREGKSDKFLRLKHMKVPDYTYWLSSGGQDDCERKCLQNCSCLAYAYYSGIGCMVWYTSLIDVQQLSADGADLYIRLAHSELGEPNQGKLIITLPASLCSAIFVAFMYYGWKWMRQRYVGQRSTNKKMPVHDHYTFDENIVHDKFQDLPLFEFEKLEVATNFFSMDQKIGQGGFGSVYKGKLEDGREIAVKRLSRGSGQGLQEFMNEVVMISKLQHRNLVRLLGCCIERDEKLLVYEFMPNKSLDALLFDPSHKKLLDWNKRFDIVKGICRGLLYLHRDSRLKIIHRDLKPSNILLDEELNPKISDFGMARIFDIKQDQANTLRVVGTYGYMSPEYAMEGRFSEKSDVFSLGVLLLEIVSGKRNNRFADNESLSLLSYAWKCWNENDNLLLIDPTLDIEPSSEGQILKCIQLGLLCVQEYPEDRPTISRLVYMLDVNEVTELPRPKKPGFTQKKAHGTNGMSQNDEETGSVNQVSLTVFSGR